MERILKKIYENKKRWMMLRNMSLVFSFTVAAFFGLELLLLVLEFRFLDALIVAGAAAAGYVAVTVARHIINAKRPYEVYDFYDVPPKDKKGHSFPSRHSYSAFVISVLSYLLGLPICIGVSILSVGVAVCRALSGMHFVRDVLVGALVGIAFGGAGLALAIIF